MSDLLNGFPNRPLYIPEVRDLHDDDDVAFDIAPLTIIPQTGEAYIVVLETETTYAAAGFNADRDGWELIAKQSTTENRQEAIETVDKAANDWVETAYEDREHERADDLDIEFPDADAQ